MPLRKVLLLLFILLLGTGTQIKAQCLCGHARFRLVLPGLKPKGKQRNYTIRTLTGDELFKRDSFFTSEINGDTVNFGYSTHAGMDTLSFVIESPDKKKMTVTSLHLHYDINYTIDLITFTPGSFLFDWTKIGGCLKEQRDSILVQCGQTSFYLLEKAKPEQYFVPRHIRPSDLMLFKEE